MEHRGENSAGRWRIEFARQVAWYYSGHEGIRMILLGGSPSRGLSDDYSDLDVVVYWEAIDLPWLEQRPLDTAGGDFVMLHKMGDARMLLEEYYFADLKVDLGHATLGLWDEWVTKVVDNHDPNPHLQKSLQGFIEAIPLHGEAAHRRWCDRILPYPRQLAVNTVRTNLRFFTRGCLLHQGLERGDMLFFFDGMCMMMKHLVAVYGGLNMMYLSTIEPRWIEFELSRMIIKPAQVWERMKTILTLADATSIKLLDELVDETLDLVDVHMPEHDTSRLRKMLKLEVKACPEPPEFVPYSGRSRES
ncbi:hypothetical protein JW905_14950 [bacterium]|nr:hypothetical protein [candidate division CSSED10-310 bacterium]